MFIWGDSIGREFKMKRIVAFLLSVVLVLSSNSFVYAAETQPSDQVTEASQPAEEGPVSENQEPATEPVTEAVTEPATEPAMVPIVPEDTTPLVEVSQPEVPVPTEVPVEATAASDNNAPAVNSSDSILPEVTTPTGTISENKEPTVSENKTPEATVTANTASENRAPENNVSENATSENKAPEKKISPLPPLNNPYRIMFSGDVSKAIMEVYTYEWTDEEI